MKALLYNKKGRHEKEKKGSKTIGVTVEVHPSTIISPP